MGGEDVFFDQFFANGTLQVGPSRVNNGSGNFNNFASSVAMDSRNFFTVTWTLQKSGGNGSILMQQFDNTGSRRGPINVTVANSANSQSSAVAAIPTEMIVSYEQNTGSQLETFYVVYNDGGTCGRGQPISKRAFPPPTPAWQWTPTANSPSPSGIPPGPRHESRD